MVYLEHPSITAASSSSFGRPPINCIIIKTKKALENQDGKISGTNVFTRPSSRKIMYCGIITTWAGSIKVDIMHANKKFLPGKRILAKEYATREDDIVTPIVDSVVIIKEFIKKTEKSSLPKPLHPCMKLSRLKLSGSSFNTSFNISKFVLNEPDIIHRTG